MLVPCVNYLAANHWNQMLNESVYSLKEILQKIDTQDFNNALQNDNQQRIDKNLRINQPPEERNKLDQKWRNFEKIAKKNNPNFVEPVMPFSVNYVICIYNSVYKNIYKPFINYIYQIFLNLKF